MTITTDLFHKNNLNKNILFSPSVWQDYALLIKQRSFLSDLHKDGFVRMALVDFKIAHTIALGITFYAICWK